MCRLPLGYRTLLRSKPRLSTQLMPLEQSYIN
jgi:hypothetical protein